MILKLWQTINNFWHQLYSKNRLAIAGSANMIFIDTNNNHQFILNTLFAYEQSSDTDGSDFDAMIDTIMIPEPIDQPMPVEPVGGSDDD